jgi:di/tricarboxylate transporter
MTPIQIFVALVVLVPVLLLVFNKLRSDVAALLIALVLGLAQFAGLPVLGEADAPAQAVLAIAGFGQPVVITLFALFIITIALEDIGVTRVIAQQVMKAGGDSEAKLIVLFAGFTAFMSLIMNNLAAGALMLPSAMAVARKTDIRPSKLLIPVAYGSMLGGAATYFTTANIIMSNLLTVSEPPQAPLGILSFASTGGLIAIAGILYLGLLGKRLLPNRRPALELDVARRTQGELEVAYQLGERLWQVQVQPNAWLAGKPLAETTIGDKLGLSIIFVWRDKQSIFLPSPQFVLQAGDTLLVIGREDRVCQIEPLGARIDADNNGSISARGVSFIEVILSPHTRAEGQTLRELDFRNRYGFTGVALLRGQRSYRTDVGIMPIQRGDSLLMVGRRDGVPKLRSSPDFIVLEPDAGEQPLNKPRAIASTAILLGVIVASIAGVPVFLASLAGALLMVLTRLVTFESAYRRMEWPALFLIAGMFAASTALVNTGLAALVGDAVVALVGPLGPLGLAAGMYVLTGLLMQLMGGQVTALVTGPIAISAAISAGVDPQAVAVATAIGCSAFFLLPTAHPVNVMMIGPGGYRFSDFARSGWLLTLLSFAMLLIGLKAFWGL